VTHRDEHLELAAVYALGALDGEDRAHFEAHLAGGCAICEVALREAAAVADDLVLAIDPVAPPPRVKARLLARVQGQQAPQPRRSPWIPLALAASLLVAIALGTQVQTLRVALEGERREAAGAATRLARAEEAATQVDRLRAERDAVQTKLAAAERSATAAQAQLAEWRDLATRLEETQARLAQAEDALALLTGPGIQTVSLAGQSAAPGARARAFLDPERGRLLLYVYDLPPPPAGKTYQLWVILGGMPIDAGTFGVQPDGRTRYDARPVPGFEGQVTVAVTIEPAGGVPQPTGPMVLAGS
jgi:hypothetical protein